MKKGLEKFGKGENVKYRDYCGTVQWWVQRTINCCGLREFSASFIFRGDFRLFEGAPIVILKNLFITTYYYSALLFRLLELSLTIVTFQEFVRSLLISVFLR